jgi:hypothetical protein
MRGGVQCSSAWQRCKAAGSGPSAALRELIDLGVGFVSPTEALDLTTPTGRAMAGLLALFAEFERDNRNSKAVPKSIVTLDSHPRCRHTALVT